MKAVSLSDLLSPHFMVKQILPVHNAIYKHIRDLPKESFNSYFVPSGSGLKQLAMIDLIAERAFISAVTAKFGNTSVRMVGEESLNDVNLENETRTCVLIDMIDGTDLLQRNFANWCSAIVVFKPQERDILAAYVAIPRTSLSETGYLYYATKAPGAYKIPLRSSDAAAPIPLDCAVRGRTLRDASVCMYSQKNANFESLLSLSRKRKLAAWLRANNKKPPGKEGRGESNFRFYNFAGNPMMARIGDGIVDVVFDLVGQAPHDVLPGAFIAAKAGAVFGHIDGRPISTKEMGGALVRPAETRLSYVLSANRLMFDEMTRLLA
jgi:fructose-1,6-bisphosphatase/inositol monophosphatase family enzyme